VKIRTNTKNGHPHFHNFVLSKSNIVFKFGFPLLILTSPAKIPILTRIFCHFYTLAILADFWGVIFGTYFAVRVFLRRVEDFYLTAMKSWTQKTGKTQKTAP
jgi:predicted permease